VATRVFRSILVISLVIVMLISGFFGYFIYTVLSMDGLPPVEPFLTTRFYYATGDLLATRSVENRIEIPLSEIPAFAQEAIIAIEDERFYSHPGIDIAGIARAMVRNLQERRITQGGSTISQQLARNLFLTHERTYTRKFQEAALTLHIERIYSKNEILEMYLNTIYFGRGAYGIEAASLTYFGKNAHDLSLAEATFLVGRPQRPSMSWEAALQRQKIILAKMTELGYISPKEQQEALAEELVPYQRAERLNSLTQYYLDTIIEKELKDLLTQDEDADLLYRGGLRIYTTLDPAMQQAAEKAFTEFMPAVTGVDARGVSQPQGALMAMDPKTGYVKAMVGGRDFRETQYNRAVLARVPAGSAFKPFVYAAAMEKAGFTAATLLDCEPISIRIPNRPNYEPTDYGGNFHNRPLTVREAIKTSCNISAVKANIAVGPGEAVSFAQRMGFGDHLQQVVSLPLSSEVTMLEMTVAQTPFANRGIKSEAIFVTRVEDARGQVIYESKPQQTVVLDEGIAFIVSDMMKDVFGSGGTATHLAPIINRPAAVKTGTAEKEKSVYMIGYTPELIATVYVANDDNTSLRRGSTGGNTAGPIWANFMREALKDMPVTDFQQPANVIRVALCPETNLLANPACTLDPRMEYFITGTEPGEECGPENCSGCQNQWWWPWRPYFWRESN
jgi:penicillin-binding protein 2D